MYRNREAAHGSKQARHYQRWFDKYSTLPLTCGMTYGQISRIALGCAAFVLGCFAFLHLFAAIMMAVR